MTPMPRCYVSSAHSEVSLGKIVRIAEKHALSTGASRDAPVDNPCFSAKIALYTRIKREDRIAKTT